MLIKGQISYILSRPAIPNFIPFFMKTFWNSGCFLFCFLVFFMGRGVLLLNIKSIMIPKACVTRKNQKR